MESFTELIKKHSQEIKDVIGGSDSEQLQRTEEWSQAHKGIFSGSEIKKLNTVTQTYSRKSWDDPAKLISFGDTAKKYIYRKFKEIEKGYVCDSFDLFQFRYGKRVEPVIMQMLTEKYKTKFELKEMGFVLVPGFEHCLGASPDNAFMSKLKLDGVEVGIEIKSAMNWDTHYTRTQEEVNDKHIDFWQLQTEMMALQVDKILYVTSDAPKNAQEVIDEPNDDIVRDMINNSITVREIKASEFHQKIIKTRALIGYDTIKRMMSGDNLDKALELACSNIKL